MLGLIEAGPTAVARVIANLQAGHLPKFVQTGYQTTSTYYDGPLGKRTIVSHEAIFVLAVDEPVDPGL